MCNMSAKMCHTNLHIQILDYDWLMNNRVWSGPIKSFAFKSSARPGWRNLWCNFFPLLRDTCALISNHMITYTN